MNNEFKLAMQLTMVDFLSGAAQAARRNILSMGAAGKEVQRDFDQMTAHISRGLKSFAVVNYGWNRMKPGVMAAADMQEATLDVKMNLAESGQNAGDLARQLNTVRATAVDIQKQMPFGGQEVMGIENVLLKAGLKLNDVTAKGGAAWAASALATISKESPVAMGEGLVKIATPFNMKGGQYSDLAEFIAKVDQASVTSVPEIVEGMKYVAGNAAQLKVDWKEILTSMGVLAQSGLSGSIGGTSLNMFLSRLNGHSRETKRTIAGLNGYLKQHGASPLEFWDKNGQLKKLPAIVANMRQAMAPLTDKQRSLVMTKIFGEEGGRAANALIKEGAGSWEEIVESIKKAESLQAKLNIRLEGFTANLKSLQGTSKTTAASIFDPWLKPLTEISEKMNSVMAAAGKFADAHPKTTAAVNGVAATGLAAIAGYGVYNLIKGGMAGSRVLKGLKGLGGTALGVAEGKMLQAATGVSPVFVTNAAEIGQAASSGGSVADKALEGAGMAAMAKKVWGLATTPVAKGASYLPMLASRAGLAGLAFGGGYAIGTGFNSLLNWQTRQMTSGKYNTLGERMYDAFHREQFDMRYASAIESARSRNAQKELNLYVQIDSQGRIVSRSDSMEMGIKTMKRGAFFEDMMSTDGMFR